MRITIVLAVLVLSATLYASHCDFAFAQDLPAGRQASTNSGEVNLEDLGTLDESGAIEIGESLIHPASPLYFLKAIREKIEMAIASSSEAKAITEVEFAQRRLREVRALLKLKRQDLIPPVLERYKAHIKEAGDLSSRHDELTVRVGEAVSRHLDVLQRVYDQAGNPTAKASIRAAIERAEEHNRILLEKLDLVSQQELIRKVALKQALACRFMMREASSSALNDTERAFLKDKVGKCKEGIRENLQDELNEIRQKRMELRMEGKRPQSTPSAAQ